MSIEALREIVWDYYRHHGRALPWREPAKDGSFDPYRILVSEMMLQQTQVSRVVPKYLGFLEQFPDLATLSEAQLAVVLAAWSGLGYNRRAKYLHEAAKTLMHEDGPWRQARLEACKGIGPNTAAAVLAYAHNQPLVFVETNIRTVFIHHFFRDKEKVGDKELLPLVAAALDREHPREFYWALMDYGVYIKATIGNMSRSSKHYTKQSKFAGSKRQLRGQVLRILLSGKCTRDTLGSRLADARLEAVVGDLLREGLIIQKDNTLALAE